MNAWPNLVFWMVVGFFGLAWCVTSCTQSVLKAIAELAEEMEAIKSRLEEMED